MFGGGSLLGGSFLGEGWGEMSTLLAGGTNQPHPPPPPPSPPGLNVAQLFVSLWYSANILSGLPIMIFKQ